MKNRLGSELDLNLRILCEKNLQHQLNMYHVFVDFKKLLTEYRRQPYGPNIVRTTEQLYDKAISAVQMKDSIGE